MSNRPDYSREDDGCGCLECLGDQRESTGLLIRSTRMVLCPKCGNKRCPHASDHRSACTGSNEVGQSGSVYRRDQDYSREDVLREADECQVVADGHVGAFPRVAGYYARHARYLRDYAALLARVEQALEWLDANSESGDDATETAAEFLRGTHD